MYENGPINVIEHGGEVEFATDRPNAPADRIEFFPGGWVKLVFKKSYQKEFHPPHKIDTVHTHTSEEEENAEWW